MATSSELRRNIAEEIAVTRRSQALLGEPDQSRRGRATIRVVQRVQHSTMETCLEVDPCC